MRASARAGASHARTSSSSTGRWVSPPKAIGSSRTTRQRVDAMTTPTAPGTRASSWYSAKPGGRNRSKQSHGMSTTRATPSAPRSIQSWVIAPPESLATTVTSCRSSAPTSSPSRPAMPSGVRSASARIARRCAPSGRSGSTQRKRSASSATTPSQTRPSTSSPWTKSSVGPSAGPTSRTRSGPADRSRSRTRAAGSSGTVRGAAPRRARARAARRARKPSVRPESGRGADPEGGATTSR